MQITECSRPFATTDQVDDLLIHAGVATTLAHLAAQAGESHARTRYLANADAALSDIQREANQLRLPAEDAVALMSTLRELAALLASLHGDVRGHAVQTDARRPAPAQPSVHLSARLARSDEFR